MSRPIGAVAYAATLTTMVLLAGSTVPSLAGTARGKVRAELSRVDPALRRLVEQHSERVLGVIIQTDASAAGRVRQAVTALGGKAGQPFQLVDGFPATLSGRGLTRIARMPGVRDISADLHTQATGDCINDGKVAVSLRHLR